MTLKELAALYKVRPELIRALLAEGLVPAEKRLGTWHVTAGGLERLEAMFNALRRPVIERKVVETAQGQTRCPNCHCPTFLPKGGSTGWSEFYQCGQCEFSLHRSNFSDPDKIAGIVKEFRLQRRAGAGGGWRHAAESDRDRQA
ncbi:MAG: hypothetical protein J0I12_13015 [Candidatus Eremiobacteraeota bacterium]|nr:hypothetical protein [Candidatus Eremiobacteraeota bacterium]